MCTEMIKLRNIFPTTRTHNGTVIFLHGSGDTGSNLAEWVRFILGRDMDFEHIKIIYPTAPVQPYTPLSGQLSNVWFDRRAISIKALENRESLSLMYKKMNDLIQNEVDLGVLPNRIIIGGFSMGGALALHIGYHLNCSLAGIFACSSFLNRDSIIYETLEQKIVAENNFPELRMYHGAKDELVPLYWGKETFEKLTKLGVNGQFITLDNALHELKKQQILDIRDWILKKLPDKNQNTLNL
ncbi:lysophospholipase-like protein 1 isoform X1 [Bactrocera tryoni]|uniref:lysophospholipase-like protein 1 isoform X1 n=1 Tax=Bactrocera tryoni TaxID=59916 RepID=UPI001A96170C|nr:lysophospholipase-like protein 1 isoform X1 [Bactrocera tryoni]